MAIGTGAAALIGAGAPGVAQGAQGAINSYQQYQGDKAADQMNAQTGGDPTNMADASHPVWSFLNNVIGGSKPAPAPGASPDQGIPAMAAPTFAGPAAPQGKTFDQAMAPTGYQHGGMVKSNFGIPTLRPGFTDGPSMGQGIIPASTEGQILTMDAGGVVPQYQQPGITGVPMNGRGAALIEGIQAGQNIGQNIKQAWEEHHRNSAIYAYADQAKLADADRNPTGAASIPNGGNPQDLLGHAKGAVEGFFQHLHDGTLNETSKPNSDLQELPQPGIPPKETAPGGTAAPNSNDPGIPSPAGAPGAAGSPPPGAPDAAGSPPPGAPDAAGSPPPGAPGAAGSPPPGAPGTAGSPPNGAAPQPGQAGAGQPQSVDSIQQQATAASIAKIANDPKVQAGIPDPSPAQAGKAHSLTPEYWAKLNDLKWEAVKAAAATGEDPAKIYESLTAMQTAHFQGQVLRQVATASRAYDNGNMDAVAQALKNINYYLPNGQDIDVRKATPQDVAANPGLAVGDLVHSNPYANMYGHQGEPQVIKVDQNYLQSLGQGALDPQKMQQAQQGMYSAQMEAREKMTTANAAATAAQGKLLWGAAADKKANILAQNQDLDRQLKGSQTDLNEANAGKANRYEPIDRSGQPKQTPADANRRQMEVGTYLDNVTLGQRQVEPVKNPDGSPNLSPAAGRPVPNPALVPTVYKGLTPDQNVQVKNFGGKFAAANPGMPVSEAAELAARVVRTLSSKNPADQTHIGPDGKRYPNWVPSAANHPGVAQLWLGNHYRNFNTAPNIADDAAPSPIPGNDQPAGGSGAQEPEDSNPMSD